MPKKTKKEKLLASYHKKIRLLENRQTIKSSPQIKVNNFESPPITIQTTKTSTAEPPQYFFSDLKKSLLLITLIIGVEVGLYAVKLVK